MQDRTRSTQVSELNGYDGFSMALSAPTNLYAVPLRNIILAEGADVHDRALGLSPLSQPSWG